MEKIDFLLLKTSQAISSSYIRPVTTFLLCKIILATLQAYADDLAALTLFINTRLDQRYWHAHKDEDGEDALLDRGDPFCWRYEVQSSEVPGDIEEITASLFEA